MLPKHEQRWSPPRTLPGWKSVVAVVTAPGKTAEITEGLTKVGYQVEQQTMDVEMADGSDASSVSGSESSEGSQ